MDDHESGDHDLEDVSREIVVEEEGPVVEEKRQKVEEVSAKENLSDLNKFLPQIWKKIKIIWSFKQFQLEVILFRFGRRLSCENENLELNFVIWAANSLFNWKDLKIIQSVSFLILVQILNSFDLSAFLYFWRKKKFDASTHLPSGKSKQSLLLLKR